MPERCALDRVGRDDLVVDRVQAAREAGEQAGDREGEEAHALRVVADELGALRIVADRVAHPPDAACAMKACISMRRQQRPAAIDVVDLQLRAEVEPEDAGARVRLAVMPSSPPKKPGSMNVAA